MLQLKMGPHLALDASSTGDSYFVKMKLKSIYNTQLGERHPSMARCSRGFKVVSLPSNLFSKVYLSTGKKILGKSGYKGLCSGRGFIAA